MARLHPAHLVRPNLPRHSRWFFPNKKDYGNCVVEDFRIRETIGKYFKKDSYLSINIARTGFQKVVITIITHKPELILSNEKKLEKIKNLLKQINKNVHLNIHEPEKPDIYPQYHGEAIVNELMNKTNLRIFVNKLFMRLKKTSVNGMKIIVSGRLAGATMAKRKTYSFGNVPKNDFSCYVDEYTTVANTNSGSCGVRVTLSLKKNYFLSSGISQEGREGRERRDNRRNNRDFHRSNNSKQPSFVNKKYIKPTNDDLSDNQDDLETQASLSDNESDVNEDIE